MRRGVATFGSVTFLDSARDIFNFVSRRPGSKRKTEAKGTADERGTMVRFNALYKTCLEGTGPITFRRILHVMVLIIPLIVVAERYCCFLGAP